MLSEAYLGGRRWALDPRLLLGEGGEAEVYGLPDGRALKVFKPPEHADFTGRPEDAEAARARLQEHQRKLRAFPAGLPERVVVPEELATDRSGRRVVGYAMRRVAPARPLSACWDPALRSAELDVRAVLAVFADLQRSLGALHARGVVVGDLNAQNLLIQPGAAYLIDADSYTLPGFPCRVYTERVVDPLRCDPAATRPVPCAPATAASDWYALAVLLFRALLLVDPWGGVHRPAPPELGVAAAARPLRGPTVLGRHVLYPKAALPPAVLPEQTLRWFMAVLRDGVREPPPPHLLDPGAFLRCASCGIQHARRACPQCATTVGRSAGPSPAAPNAPSAGRRKIFVGHELLPGHTDALLAATVEGGRPRWLVRRGDGLYREDGRCVAHGLGTRPWTVGLVGADTVLLRGTQAVVLSPGAPPERLEVDPAPEHGGASMVAAGGRLLWLGGGALLRAGRFGPQRLGDVLPGRTALWSGAELGLVLTRAGSVRRTLLIDPGRRGLLEVPWPQLPSGRWLHAGACCSARQVWLWVLAERDASEELRLFVIGADARTRASASWSAGEGPPTGGLLGAAATDDGLLVPTDEGLQRWELQGHDVRLADVYEGAGSLRGSGVRVLAEGRRLYLAKQRSLRSLELR